MSLRWKFLSIISIPMLLLVGASSYIGGQATHAARQSHTVEKLAQLSVGFTALVQATQNERDLSEQYVSGQTLPLGGSKGTIKQKLDAARVQLNQGVAFLDQQLAPNSPFQSVSGTMRTDLVQLVHAYRHLPLIRGAIDAKAPTMAPVQFYNQLIAGELTLPSLTAQSSASIVLQQRLNTYEAALQMGEATRQERNIIASAKAAGGFRGFPHAAFYAPSFSELPTALGLLRRWEGVYSLDATPAQNVVMQHALNLPSTNALRAYRLEVLSWPQTHKISIPMLAWNSAIQARQAALLQVQPSLGSSLETEAHSVYVTAHNREVTILVIALAGILLGLGLTLVLVRRMVQPLVALTETARTVSEELPRMVERMQEPGATPDMSVGTIPVRSNDEIGRLSDAFNNVNQVTIRVAQEQAALRGSIAEMFVNVARRNQALLGKQLSFIDELEQNEEDPDALDNLFRLDHLATRMRRNAESLLVLAGIDDTRRLRRPVALSDIVRTAVGEVEYFDRIDLSAQADPLVSGRVALSMAHMLAEIIENATTFSNPTTRVQVSCRWHRDGHVLVTVIDEGLGLTEQELEDANERLANPPIGDTALSQRLGFLVVGRLARRLEAKVSLSHNPLGGTMANILLPSSVFVDESGAELASPASAKQQEPFALAQAGEPSRDGASKSLPKQRFANPVATEPYDQRNNEHTSGASRVSAQDSSPTVPDRWETRPALPKRIVESEPAAQFDGAAAGAPESVQRTSLPKMNDLLDFQNTSGSQGNTSFASGVNGADFVGDLPEQEYKPAVRTSAEVTKGTELQGPASRHSRLTRRTPGESTAGNAVPSAEEEGEAGPQRNPNEVRGLLTAYRSGVERGRATPGGIFEGEEEYQ